MVGMRTDLQNWVDFEGMMTLVPLRKKSFAIEISESDQNELHIFVEKKLKAKHNKSSEDKLGVGRGYLP